MLVLEGRITRDHAWRRSRRTWVPARACGSAAEPGSAPERLGIAGLPASVDRRGAGALASAATGSDLDRRGAVGSGAGRVGRGGAGCWSRSEPATLRQPSSAPRPQPVGVTGWLDDQTSLLTILLIAAGGLTILVMPGMVLGQSLRQQWRDRAGAKGRRRRGLTEG